jgi:predicted exporter
MDLQRDILRDRLLDPYLPMLVGQLNANSGDAYKGSALSEPALPRLISSLRGQTKEIYWSIVPLAISVAEVPSTLGKGPFWTLVDPADAYSRLLAQYRLIATFGLAGGALTTGLILLVIYRQFSALWILLPTMLAMISTPSILALLGLPYSFFSAMGLFLVIGAGVDYSIFQWEHGGSRGRWTRLGITLAALMTCTSLGLLGFSSVLPVASFGVTVALGIFLSLILSPIASFGRASQSESQKTPDHA